MKPGFIQNSLFRTVQKLNKDKDCSFDKLRIKVSGHNYMICGEPKDDETGTTKSFIIQYDPLRKRFLTFPHQREVDSFEDAHMRLVQWAYRKL